MEFFKINGKSYNVLVTSIEENFNILYSENTGRTIDGRITLDPIGTFFGHKVTCIRKKGYEKDFDDLYELLTIPRRVEEEEDALLFEVAHLQDSIAYRGYVSNGIRPLIKIDEKQNKIHWGEFTMNIIPIRAQVTPE